jgi:DNA-binding transcriptional LysR family regulator
MVSIFMPHTELQLDWLRSFVAVVDAGSLSAAAPWIHRSQSAVSMQLKKLEDAIGQPVLLRGPRQMELTQTGQELLGYARRMLQLHTETWDALQGTQLTGKLRLGVPDDYAAPYLTPVLRSFAHQHAGVEIELICQQSTTLIPRIKRNELDLAIISLDQVQRGIHLFDEPLAWVGSAQYETWRRNPLPIAVYEHGCTVRKHALATLTKSRKPYRIVYESPSLAGQLAAVESGLAIAVLARCSVPAHLQILDEKQGLPFPEPVRVALIRSQNSKGNAVADAMHAQALRTLSRSEASLRI